MKLLRHVFAFHSGICVFATTSGSSKGAGPMEGVLNVHIVSHTHDDVGWLKTVEEYYSGKAQEVQNAAVKPILDNVVAELGRNPTRKFIYVEMAYFSRWWRDQDAEKQEEVRTLVKEGRLQFANGGWASNDEATPTFVDIIDQHTLGTTLIANLFGSLYVPTVGWQMDPFGHSHFQSVAYSKMGMNAWFLGRIDIEEYEFRKSSQTLETIHSNILTGITQMYQAPRGFHWGWVNDPEITEANHKDRVAAFVALCMEKQAMYNFADEKTTNIMFTFGDDFEYGNAEKWFTNIDKLIKYLNEDPQFNAFYSTPDIYTKSRFDQRKKSPHKWSVESGVSDWFPYCDGEAQYDATKKLMQVNQAHALWTGYFSSRPLLKKLVRTSSAVLELCRIAEIFGTAPTHPATAATALWEALAVVQHHDGVSGTSKQRVVVDYVAQLESGIDQCKSLIRNSRIFKSAQDGGKYYSSLLSSKNAGMTAADSHLCDSTNDRGYMAQSGRQCQPISSHSMDAGKTSADPHLGDPTKAEKLSVSFGYYKGYAYGPGKERTQQASGTYIFRPDCDEGAVAACEPIPLPADVPHTIRTEGNRIEWEVGPLSPYFGQEVVLIIKTDIENGGKFFTDSNGFNWIDREVDQRKGYTYNVTDPVSANFYPVVGGIGISDEKSTLVVTPDRSVGGTSLRKGEVQIMVHRRLIADDGKGMNEPLDERDEHWQGIVVKGVTFFEFTKTRPIAPSRNLIRPPVDVEEITKSSTKKLAWTPLKVPLPEAIVLTHFHRLNVAHFCQLKADRDCWLVRVMHADTDPLGNSPPVEINWRHYLNTLNVFQGKELTLNGGKLITEVKQFAWVDGQKTEDMRGSLDDSLNSGIYPGDIKTFVFEVQTVVPTEVPGQVIVAAAL
jgi:hypothetical protein